MTTLPAADTALGSPNAAHQKASASAFAPGEPQLHTCAARLLRGRLQIAEGVINVMAEHAAPLDMGVRSNSRDFR